MVGLTLANFFFGPIPKTLERIGNPTPATALADWERHEAVVKLLVSGNNREPIRAKMLPPLENRVGRLGKLIALSRERFAMPRAKIDAKLRRWMNHQPIPDAGDQ